MTQLDSIKGIGLGKHELAARVARDIPDGYWVNLGIGLPTEISDIEQTDREVVFHCENGVLGVGPRAKPGTEIAGLVNASKEHVTLVAGGAFVSHCDSFALIRGGHLDLAVLGAFQVSFGGDLANWHRPGDTIPAVGGAMDLAAGARQVWVMMRLFDPDGGPKLLERCTHPLTAAGVVDRVYTDMATFELPRDGTSIRVRDVVDGITVGELSELLGTDLKEVSTP